MPPRKPFPVRVRSFGEVRADQTAWMEGLKERARENLRSADALRIAWQHRFGVPAHPRFEDYTPEEIVLEMWEQHYFENPDSIELRGVSRRRDPKTGFVYYVTGDPLIDSYERAFARGEVPDMGELSAVKPGRDIFRAPVFVGRDGSPVAAQTGLQGVREGAGGETIAAGAKVSHTDFRSDEWLGKALAEDTALKALAEG